MTKKVNIHFIERKKMKPEKVINIHSHIDKHRDLKARIKNMKKWNIVRFCCLCMPDFCKDEYYTNDDFLAAKKDLGSLIVGLAAVNLHVYKIDSPQDIERYRNQGFVGLKFILNCHPYDHEAYFPIYEKTQQLNMPIIFHMGFLAKKSNHGEYKITSDNMRPWALDRITRTFPNLKLIGAHLGNPEMRVAIMMLERHENVYFDFSGECGDKYHVRDLKAALGPPPGLPTDYTDPQENRALGWFEKLVFATDNPEPDIWIPNCEQIMDHLKIPDTLRKKFYFQTASDIFGWKDL